jgi:hypothetical protein
VGTSDAANVPFVVVELQRLRPKSVLDVGVGFGKWGVLAREYLEACEGRFTREDRAVVIEGIEIFERYRNPLWSATYDRVHVGDARVVLPTLGQFDVGLFCDVIEHMPRADGRALLEELLRHCQSVILTTPLSFWSQGAQHGNAHEAHVCLWTPADLARYSGRVVELGATFGAVLTSGGPPDSLTPLRRRLDHVGVRLLLRALARRLYLTALGRRPRS